MHITIDTFSGFICASLQTGEATKHVISHVLSCLAAVPQPKILKTDNGPGYASASFKQFCAQMDIKHVTGIPYNPQGQGIVERTHQTLKNMLFKLQSGGGNSISSIWQLQDPLESCTICLKFSYI